NTPGLISRQTPSLLLRCPNSFTTAWESFDIHLVPHRSWSRRHRRCPCKFPCRLGLYVCRCHESTSRRLFPFAVRRPSARQFLGSNNTVCRHSPSCPRAVQAVFNVPVRLKQCP